MVRLQPVLTAPVIPVVLPMETPTAVVIPLVLERLMDGVHYFLGDLHVIIVDERVMLCQSAVPF